MFAVNSFTIAVHIFWKLYGYFTSASVKYWKLFYHLISAFRSQTKWIVNSRLLCVNAMRWRLIECSHRDEILIHSIKRWFKLTKNYMHWWGYDISLYKIYQNFNFNVWRIHLCSPSCTCMSLFFIVQRNVSIFM